MKLTTCLHLVPRLRISGAKPLALTEGVDRATSLSFKITENKGIILPVPVAARSKAWFCSRSLFGIGGLDSRRGHGCLSVVSVVCRQV